MKTLEDFTEEIKNKIPEYQDKCTKDLYNGVEAANFDPVKAKNYIEKIYEIANQKKPVIIFADDPVQYKIYFELIQKDRYLKLIQLIFSIKNKSITGKKLNNELHNELRSELDSELYSELHNGLDRELNNELYKKLDDELHTELDDKLSNKLDTELHTELYVKLYNELRRELDNALHNELDDELYDELHTELNKNKIRAHWLYLCSIFSRAYLTWYKFIKDEFNIHATKGDLLDWLYNNSFNGIGKCYFTKGYVLILKVPKLIKRNDIGFHSLTQAAIQWDNYSIYYINGRKMPEWIFTKFKNNTLAKMDFLNEENEDVKAGIFELIESKGEGSMLEFLGGIEVDKQTILHKNGDLETLTLYKSTETFKQEEDLNGNSNVPLAWLKMICPSTGTTYLISTDSSFSNAIEAAKYHRPNRIPSEISYNWNSRN